MERDGNTEAERNIRESVALVEVYGGPALATFIRQVLQRTYPSAYVAVLVEEQAQALVERLLAAPGELEDLSRLFRGVDIYTLAALARTVDARLSHAKDEATLQQIAVAVQRRRRMLGRPDDGLE